MYLDLQQEAFRALENCMVDAICVSAKKYKLHFPLHQPPVPLSVLGAGAQALVCLRSGLFTLQLGFTACFPVTTSDSKGCLKIDSVLSFLL